MELAWQPKDLVALILSYFTIHQLDWLLDEISRTPISRDDYLSIFSGSCAFHDDSTRRALLRFFAARLRFVTANQFSEKLLHRESLFVESHELLGSFICVEDNLFSAARKKIEVFSQTQSASRKAINRILPERFRQSQAERWWRKLLMTFSRNPNYLCSKYGLLLAYEIEVRKITVQKLFEKMKESGTENPQAALFLFDLEKLSKPIPPFRLDRFGGLLSKANAPELLLRPQNYMGEFLK